MYRGNTVKSQESLDNKKKQQIHCIRTNIKMHRIFSLSHDRGDEWQGFLIAFCYHNFLAACAEDIKTAWTDASHN